MRYCKYFIAKFNEAAALHLDFTDICISQLHTGDWYEAILHTLIYFMTLARCMRAALTLWGAQIKSAY